MSRAYLNNGRVMRCGQNVMNARSGAQPISRIWASHATTQARVLAMADVKERMYAISFDPAPTTPEEYDQIVRKQLETFGRVAKAVGLISK